MGRPKNNPEPADTTPDVETVPVVEREYTQAELMAALKPKDE